MKTKAIFVILAAVTTLSLPAGGNSTEKVDRYPSTNGAHQEVQVGSDLPKRKRNVVWHTQYPLGPSQQAGYSSLWQPVMMPFARPYIIPVLGAASNRYPMYYPPQPVYTNLPNNLYLPPVINNAIPPNSYLPPKDFRPPSTETPHLLPPDNKNDQTNPNLANRNTFTDDDDDAPVWDIVQSNPNSNNRFVPENIAPTQRPQRVSTHPPLIHGRKRVNAIAMNARPFIPESTTSTTTTPRPLQQRPQQQRPQQQRPEQQQPQRSEPSRCVWAIISCCGVGAGSASDVRYQCFEQLGCTGAFWDRSPCESEFAQAAVQAAQRYFNAKKKKK